VRITKKLYSGLFSGTLLHTNQIGTVTVDVHYVKFVFTLSTNRV